MADARFGEFLSTISTLHNDTWSLIPRICMMECNSEVYLEDIVKLAELLPKLRQHLICAFCDKLLSHTPLIPKEEECQHVICAGCKDNDLSTICPNEEDPCYEYEESKLLTAFIKSYTLFCYTILTSKACHNLLELAQNQDEAFPGLELVKILQEGALQEIAFNGRYMFRRSDISFTGPGSSLTLMVPHNEGNPEKDVGHEGQSQQEEEDDETSPPDLELSATLPDYEFNQEMDSFDPPTLFSTIKQEIEDIHDVSPKKILVSAQMIPFPHPPLVLPPSPTLGEKPQISEDVKPMGSSRGPNTLKWPDPDEILEMTRPLKSGRSSRSGVERKAEPSSTITTSALPISLLPTTSPGPTMSTTVSSTSSLPPPPTGIVGSVIRQVEGGGKKLKVRLPKQPSTPKVRKGCRCGNAAAAPGKLTCCGQRCPCYVENKACLDCRCKGCRNPHLGDGKKLLPGLNAVVDSGTTAAQVPGRSIMLSNLTHGGPYYPLGPLGHLPGFGSKVYLQSTTKSNGGEQPWYSPMGPPRTSIPSSTEAFTSETTNNNEINNT